MIDGKQKVKVFRQSSDNSFVSFAANFDIEVVNQLPKNLQTGIYFGWASVDNDNVHKMVMSIGWNPYYNNEHKSMVSSRVKLFTRTT